MNNVSLMGRMVRDPELKAFQGIKPGSVTNFTIAVDKSFKKEGEPDANFINCVAYNHNAEFIAKYFPKGKMIGINGEINTRSYDDKDGIKRFVTEIVVNKAYFTGDTQGAGQDSNSTPSSDTAPTPKTAPENQPKQDQYVAIDNIDDDDIPF